MIFLNFLLSKLKSILMAGKSIQRNNHEHEIVLKFSFPHQKDLFNKYIIIPQSRHFPFSLLRFTGGGGGAGVSAAAHGNLFLLQVSTYPVEDICHCIKTS